MSKNNPILGEIEHLPDNYGIGGFIPSEFKLDDEIRKSNPLVSYKDDVDEVEETNIHAKADMQLEHDFDKARGNLKDVLDNTSTILTDAIVLAQSSDWLFIITNGTMVDYAKKRIKDHIGRFTKLYYQIKEDSIDELFIKDIMKKDCIFPDIDYKIYS